MTMMILPLAMSFAFAGAPSSSEDKANYVPTRVEVDIEPLVAQSPAEDPAAERMAAEDVRDQAIQRLGKALAERDVPMADGEGQAVVKVRLQWKVYLDSHYLIRIDVERDGHTEPVTDSLECVLCNGAKLADALAQKTPELLDYLKVEPAGAAPPPELDVAADGATPAQTDPDSTTGDEPRRKIGPVGYGGIAAAVVGVAGIAGGAVLLARGEELSLEPDQRFQRIDDYRPWGGALVGVGGVVFVTGVVLVVLDQTVLRKRRKRAADRGGIRPALHARGATAGFTLRF